MHPCFALLIAGVLSYSSAADPQTETPPNELGSSDLARIGGEIASWDAFPDNQFLRTVHRREIMEAIKPLTGSQVVFSAAVDRISLREVFVEIPDTRGLQVSLRHATSPIYGNLRSVGYCGAPSAHISYILSEPISLRIGPEIDLEVAKELRTSDLLLMSGRIEKVHLLLDHFQPRAIVEIADFSVKGVRRDSPTSP